MGFATEAVVGALSIAKNNGARTARADTTPDNEPAQRVLQKAGMHEISRDDEAVLFEITLS